MKNNYYLNGWGITVCLLLSFSLFSQFTYECPPDLNQIGTEMTVQTFEFPLLSDEDIMDSNDVACLSDEQNDFYYTTHTFSVSQTGQYVFEVSGLSENGLVAIYQNEPLVGEYCEHILSKGIPLTTELGYTGFNVAAPTSRVAPLLQLGQNYTLLVADNVAGNITQVGTYPLEGGVINSFLNISGTIISDLTTAEAYNFGIFNVLSYQWDNQGETITGSISDLGSYQNAEQVGLPMVLSNCALNEVMVLDLIDLNGDCGEIVISRHYDIIEDSEGGCNLNTPQQVSCDQTLTFRQLDIHDVFLPNQTVDLRSVTYPLDENGYPSPSFTGSPTIVNGLNKYELMPVLGTLASNYTDDASDSWRIIREWKIIDWCDPSSFTIFHQTLIIDNMPVSTSDNEKNTPYNRVQNNPNPFSESTLISFELKESEAVDVLIQNLQGIIIKTIHVKGVAGENNISLSGSDFPAAGIYFYTLVTKEKRVTKKMIFNR